MILGDLGADVIKVERPVIGDESRGWGPPFDPDGQSAYFLSCNRNKLSIALDFDVPDDLAVLRGLIAGADVVLENYRRGALEERGIVVAQLLHDHRRLLWCTLSGFGQDSDRPGYDFVVQAESGWMAVTGEPTGEPMKAGMALADVLAGKDLSIAMLAGLLERERIGAGAAPLVRHLHLSLAQSATAALINVAQNVLVSGQEAGREMPTRISFRTRCFTRVIGRWSSRWGTTSWQSLCRALELTDLSADASLRTNAGRLAQRERVVSAIALRVAQEPAEQWLGALSMVGVPAGVVRSVADAVRDSGASAVMGVAPSVPGSARRRPPRLDEHGPHIRRQGWDAFRTIDGESANADPFRVTRPP